MTAHESVERVISQAIDALVEDYQSNAETYLPTEDPESNSPQQYISAIEQRFLHSLRDRFSKFDSAAKLDFDVTLDTDSTNAQQPGEDETIDHRPDPKGDGVPDTVTYQPRKRDLEDTIDAADETTARETKTPRKTPISDQTELPEDYELLGTLGRGGMGVVYKARHIPLNRMVAVKMVRAGKDASDDALRRFQLEAEAAARLDHPNIVAVHDVGQHRGMPFFSIEYVDGDSLAEMLTESSMPSERLVRLMEKIARAVHYAHENEIVHRDLKPQNVLVGKDDEPKVADFGLAKRLDDPSMDETKTGEIMGTPGYMPPEQARGDKNIGPATDVYSLGGVMYFMITGRAPFVGPTPFHTIKQVIGEDPVAPSRLQPGIDRDLETICLKCLEKDTDKRYGSAAALADDLQRLREGKPIVARPITQTERVIKWCRRNRRVATLLGIVGTLFMALLIGGYISAAVIEAKRVAEQKAKEDAELKELRAKTQAELSLNVMRGILYRAQSYFQNHKDQQELQKELLGSVLSDVEDVYESHYEYDVESIFRASALRQIADIQLAMNDVDEALAKFLEAEQIALKLNKDGKLQSADESFDKIYLGIGDCYRLKRDYHKSEQYYLKSLEHRKTYFATAQIPEIAKEQGLVDVYSKLGNMMRLAGRSDDARVYLEVALEARIRWYEFFKKKYEGLRVHRGGLERIEKLAGAYGDVSKLSEDNAKFDRMRETGAKCLEYFQYVKTQKPDDFANNVNIARTKWVLGRQSLVVDEDQQAMQWLEQAIEELKQIEKQYPKHPELYKATLALIDSYFLATVAAKRLDEDPAPFHDKGIAILRTKNLKHPFYKGTLIKFLVEAGQIEEAKKLTDEIYDAGKEQIHFIFSGLGYGLIARETEDPKEKKRLTDLAIEQVRGAIVAEYENITELRKVEVALEYLQSVPAYHEMLDEEEARIKKERADSANKAKLETTNLKPTT